MADHRLNQIYSKSPTLIQNLAVTIKGLILENTRKKGLYKSYMESVIARGDWSTEQFHNYQLKCFRDLIDYARFNVPYYQKLFSSLGVSSESITCLQDIQQLPILKRDTIKNNLSAFISITTGSPLKILSSNVARQKNYAFFDGYLKSIGLNPSAKHIIIGGHIIVPRRNSTPPFWRYSYFQKSLLMSSYHLNDKFMDSYIEKIKSFAPEYIESYPSSIYTLAKHILKKGAKLKCKAIITSAETLFPEQREIIEQAFDCTVYDQYGCAEMSFFVGQCSHGKYHTRPDYGLLELVDDSGNPVPVGQPGNVICTGFINRAMPLIRYSIGDVAAYSEDSTCGCGLNAPILKEIHGRADDALIASDGQSIGRMSPVLKGFPIKESQYIQHNAGTVELLIVPDSTFSIDRDIKQINNAVQMRLGEKFQVNIRLVEQINRGKGGKLKAVISKVKA